MIAGFKGSDKLLLRKFDEAKEEVVAYLEATGQRVKPVKRKRVVARPQPVLARAVR
jgi:hypothetical protein